MHKKRSVASERPLSSKRRRASNGTSTREVTPPTSPRSLFNPGEEVDAYSVKDKRWYPGKVKLCIRRNLYIVQLKYGRRVRLLEKRIRPRTEPVPEPVMPEPIDHDTQPNPEPSSPVGEDVPPLPASPELEVQPPPPSPCRPEPQKIEELSDSVEEQAHSDLSADSMEEPDEPPFDPPSREPTPPLRLDDFKFKLEQTITLKTPSTYAPTFMPSDVGVIIGLYAGPLYHVQPPRGGPVWFQEGELTPCLKEFHHLLRVEINTDSDGWLPGLINNIIEQPDPSQTTMYSVVLDDGRCATAPEGAVRELDGSGKFYEILIETLEGIENSSYFQKLGVMEGSAFYSIDGRPLDNINIAVALRNQSVPFIATFRYPTDIYDPNYRAPPIVKKRVRPRTPVRTETNIPELDRTGTDITLRTISMDNIGEKPAPPDGLHGERSKTVDDMMVYLKNKLLASNSDVMKNPTTTSPTSPERSLSQSHTLDMGPADKPPSPRKRYYGNEKPGEIPGEGEALSPATANAADQPAPTLSPQPPDKSQLQALFMEFDKDNDGVIGWLELQACLSQLRNRPVSPTELAEMGLRTEGTATKVDFDIFARILRQEIQKRDIEALKMDTVQGEFPELPSPKGRAGKAGQANVSRFEGGTETVPLTKDPPKRVIRVRFMLDTKEALIPDDRGDLIILDNAELRGFVLDLTDEATDVEQPLVLDDKGDQDSGLDTAGMPEVPDLSELGERGRELTKAVPDHEEMPVEELSTSQKATPKRLRHRKHAHSKKPCFVRQSTPYQSSSSEQDTGGSRATWIEEALKLSADAELKLSTVYQSTPDKRQARMSSPTGMPSPKENPKMRKKEKPKYRTTPRYEKKLKIRGEKSDKADKRILVDMPKVPKPTSERTGRQLIQAGLRKPRKAPNPRRRLKPRNPKLSKRAPTPPKQRKDGSAPKSRRKTSRERPRLISHFPQVRRRRLVSGSSRRHSMDNSDVNQPSRRRRTKLTKTKRRNSLPTPESPPIPPTKPKPRGKVNPRQGMNSLSLRSNSKERRTKSARSKKASKRSTPTREPSSAAKKYVVQSNGGKSKMKKLKIDNRARSGSVESKIVDSRESFPSLPEHEHAPTAGAGGPPKGSSYTIEVLDPRRDYSGKPEKGYGKGSNLPKWTPRKLRSGNSAGGSASKINGHSATKLRRRTPRLYSLTSLGQRKRSPIRPIPADDAEVVPL